MTPTSRRGASLLAALLAATLAATCRKPEPTRAVSSVDILVPVLPDKIEPYADSRLVSRIIWLNIFEPLVTEDTSGTSRPVLLESWQNPEPDRWELRLRPGLTFHDGSPVTSADVIASLDRARASGGTLASGLADILDLAAADPLTVRLRTKNSTALLGSLSAIAISRPDAEGRLMGTAAYRVDAFEPGTSISLSAFLRHRGKPPALSTIVLRRYATTRDALELARRAPPIVLEPSKELVDALKVDARLVITGEPRGALTYLAFNATHAPFSDLRVRRAVQLAVDPQRLLDEGTPVGGARSGQVVPRGVFGSDPGVKLVDRDLPAARRLLAEAGFPDGFETTLDVSAVAAPMAALVAGQLRDAGIRVTVNPIPSSAFTSTIDEKSPFFLYTWIVGESASSLNTFFHTRDREKRRGLSNRISYSNPTLDGLLERVTAESDPEARLSEIHEALAILDHDLPWVPLFSSREARIHPKGWSVPSRPNAMLSFADIRPGS